MGESVAFDVCVRYKLLTALIGRVGLDHKAQSQSILGESTALRRRALPQIEAAILERAQFTTMCLHSQSVPAQKWPKMKRKRNYGRGSLGDAIIGNYNLDY